MEQQKLSWERLCDWNGFDLGGKGRMLLTQENVCSFSLCRQHVSLIEQAERMPLISYRNRGVGA